MSKNKSKRMPRQIQNLMFTQKIPDDRQLIQLINELASVMPGLGPKQAFKHWVLSKLPSEIRKLRDEGKLAS